MKENDVFSQVFANHPFEVFMGIAICILVFFIGWGILMHGWPKLRK